MIPANLELKIEPGSNFSAETADKIVSKLILSCQQDGFAVFYNNHFTAIKNGDRLRLGDHLITLSLLPEEHKIIKKDTSSRHPVKTDHLFYKTQQYASDSLAFLFHTEESLPPPSSVRAQVEHEQSNPLKDLELSESPKPNLWSKLQLLWRKKIGRDIARENT